MRLLGLFMLVQFIQDPADPVKSLIEKLESDELAVRDAAHVELTRLGRRAMPQLTQAATTAVGEQKTRVQRLIEHITAFGTPPLVTIEARDRPLREIAPELEKQSGVSISLVGAAADAKASVSAKETMLWKVVEDICRARGDLMYRVVGATLEIYPARFRSLPTADAQGLRFVIDRFIFDEGRFYQHGAVLTAPGARVVRIWPKMEDFVDDLGFDPYKVPRHRMEFAETGDSFFPNSSRVIHPFSFHRFNGRAPSMEATRIVRCRGTIEVLLAGREHILASIRDPLAKSSHPAGEQKTSFGITRWKIENGCLHVHFSAHIDGSSFPYPGWWIGPRTMLRYKNGEWRSPVGRDQEESTPSRNEIKRFEREARFPWPEGSAAESVDLLVPVGLIKVEIPFDFRDLPLR